MHLTPPALPTALTAMPAAKYSGLLVRVGDGAQAQATQGGVFLVPDFGRLLVFQLAAGALVDLHLRGGALVETPPVGTRRAVAVGEVGAHLLAHAIDDLLQLAHFA